jgi:hypothetical protein
LPPSPPPEVEVVKLELASEAVLVAARWPERLAMPPGLAGRRQSG